VCFYTSGEALAAETRFEFRIVFHRAAARREEPKAGSLRPFNLVGFNAIQNAPTRDVEVWIEVERERGNSLHISVRRTRGRASTKPIKTKVSKIPQVDNSINKTEGSAGIGLADRKAH